MSTKDLHKNEKKHGWLPKKCGSFCRVFLLSAVLLSCLILSGCSKKETLEYFAMDTYVQTSAYGKNAEEFLNEVNSETLRLESVFSAHNVKSELYALNNQTAPPSAELKGLVLTALDLAEFTNGAFDPTLLPLSRLWNLGSASYLPSDEEILSAMEYVGYKNVSISEADTSLGKTELDLGGIAKGYAADRFFELAGANGVDNAMGSFGGMVAVVGNKPDGSKWKIAMRDPQGEGYAAILNVSDVCISTSGAYERYFTYNGKIYHHIIDPETGYPAESDLLSATVIDTNGTRADALSTALFVMGKNQAIEFCIENNICAVLITKNNEIYQLCAAEALLSNVSEIYTVVLQ